MQILLVITQCRERQLFAVRRKWRRQYAGHLRIDDNLLDLLNSLDTWFACRWRGVGGRMKGEG